MVQYLESVNVVIRYIPGKENVLSDYVSRNIKKRRNGVLLTLII